MVLLNNWKQEDKIEKSILAGEIRTMKKASVVKQTKHKTQTRGRLRIPAIHAPKIS